LLTSEKNSQRTPADKNKELEAVLRSHQTRICVVGCGGGGNNTITRLMEVGVNGVETLAINTDAQDLLAANADDKILIGTNITKGLGAGSNPQIGEDSARENQQEIEAALQNTDMVFVTCGLGGGTGTGSAPIVAEISKKLGALTIAVVTLPFTEEGVVRWENAKLGLDKLRQSTDTIIVIQNDRLFEVVPDLPLGMAFKVADEILVNAVKGITELITEKGLVNLDFADVRAIMQNGGTAMIGIGESDGADSAQTAVEMAMQNKLLDVDITGAKSALINVTGGAQMPLKDAKRVMQLVAEKLDASAKLIWGARIDPGLDQSVRVMLIVTGLPEKPRAAAREDRKLRADAPTSALRQAKEQSPGENGVEQNLSAVAEALTPEAPPANEEAIQNSDGQTPAKAFEPAEVKAETPSGMAETAAQILGVNETPKPKRKRTAKSSTPKASAPAVEADEQVSETVRPTEQTVGYDEVAREVNAPRIAPPQFKPRATITGREEIRRFANANPGSPQPVRPKAPLVNRQEVERSSNGRPLPPPRPRPQVQNMPSPPNHASTSNRPWPGRPLESRPKPMANKTVSASNSAANYNKLFEEKSLANLQTIRESIGHLFIDPTRQETLRCMKSAATAINNAAQRFVFKEIADYAATVEGICARVLDGEINMNKKILNAFTEMPGIFEGMIQGDADAMAEAKRHQDRLKRLADSFGEGEVFQAATPTREMPRNPRPPMGGGAFSKPAAAAPGQRPAPVKKAAQPNVRPKPATEVMEYLDDLFTDGKSSSGR
jgi:cell division protein FtsZ